MTKRKPAKVRKLYGIRMDEVTMLEIQHLAVDQNKYVNELFEEAARDLLKKYSEQGSGRASDSKGRR